MTICSVKVSKIKLSWKDWIRSDHEYLTRSHSWSVWEGVSSYKLQKEDRGNGFIPKVLCFLLRNKTLFKILYWKYRILMAYKYYT